MSSRIPQSFIDELLGRTDIVEVIDSYVPLRKKGSSFQACCPFHAEKTPSFNVSQTKQVFHCFGCGVGGNVISFVMSYEKINFLEALQNLAERMGIELPNATSVSHEKNISSSQYALLEEATAFYQNSLKNTPQAIDYLKSRGISGQTAKTFRIGYVSDEWDSLSKRFLGRYPIDDLLQTGLFIKKEKGGLYDRFRHRVIFPIRDVQGRPIAFGGRNLVAGEPKYLNSPETSFFFKGKELYGLYEARQLHPNLSSLWVVEGYMDVISLSQAGVTNVVATLGTAVTSHHLKRLMRFTSEIIFCFDGDKAGQQAAWRALETLFSLMQDDYRASFILLPQGEDPDSYIKKVGFESFLETPSQSMPEFFFDTLLKEIDVTIPEGRAKLAKRATEYIQQIPGKFLQQIMLDRLSSITRIAVNRLESLSGIQSSKSFKSSVSPTRIQPQKRTARFSSIRLAIVLLLQNPHLNAQIEWSPVLDHLKLPGLSILKALYELLKQEPNLTTAMLIEHWRGTPEEAVIQKLAIQVHWVPEEGVLQELLGAINQLAAKGTDQQVEKLLQIGQVRVLKEDEKILLQQLIRSRVD